ncbi:MAG: PAS domain S-box protein, partial [Bacteroidota bacterium]
KVYQIELEMQNEEMVMIKEKAETEAKKYTSLYDCAPSGYFTLSGDGNISELNIAASQMLGKERAQLINARFGFFVSDDTLSSFNAFLKNIFISSVKESCDVTLATNNNRPQSVYLTGIVSENGGQCYITAVNITDRKLAEEALQKSETHYRTLFEKATDGIMYLSLDSEIAKVNESFAKMHGYTVEEMQNMSIQDLDTPETSQRVSERMSHLMSGETLFFNVEHYHKDGRILQLEVASSLVTIGDEKIIQTFHRNITERKQVEDELHEKKEELDRYFSSSLDLLCISDTDGYFRRLNPQWEKTLGYSLADLDGSRFLDFVHPEDLDATIAAIKHLDEQKPVLNFENRYRCKDGSYKWIEWNSVSAGKLIYAAARDVTVRKNAENEFRLHAQQLRALLKSSQNLSTSLDMHTVFQTTTDSIIELSDLKSAAIYLIEGEMLYLGATSPALPAQFPEELRRAPLKDHPHIEKAITTAQPVFIHDTAVVDLTAAERIISEQRGLRSILYLPIIVKENVIGVLIVAHIGEPRMLTVSEIDMGRTLANLSSIAIENSRLYETAKREIIERIQAEDKLRENEERLKDIIFSMAEWVWETDEKGFYTYSSQKGIDLFGKSNEDVLGKTPFDFMP